MFIRELVDLPKPYLFFALLRIVLTCIPQTGYIHPDEYFQSIEPIAEKVLHVKANKPWEFNVTQPIRTVTPIYFTVGLSYQVLKVLNLLLQRFNVHLMTSYYIVVFPRLMFCLLSFIVDWSLYRICLANSERSRSRCLVLATSYVMITYATHTFSNTIELVLFSLLLYYVAESLIFSNINIRQREYINKRYNVAETVVERAKFHKLRLYLENDSLRSFFIIATITTAGFFNRPTFAAYALTPVFFWLYRGIGFKSIATMQFHVRTIMFLVSTIPTILIFIIVDSFYFGYLTWGEIGVLKVSINNFVVTPWNFIKYNMNPTNLAQHGVHPRYVHALVNIPLLFGVVALSFYSNISSLLTSLNKGQFHYLPSVRSVRGLMTASILCPLALLSLFPHQEPRFLIPVVLPMMYLYAPAVLPEDVHTVAKASRARSTSRKTQEKPNKLKLWFLFNLVCVLFYGFIHQGGVYRFIFNLSSEIQATDNNLKYEVVTSHIYSIPQALFCQYDEVGSFRRVKRISVYEKGSANTGTVLRAIKTLLKVRSEVSSNFSYKLFLVIPESLVDNLMHFLSHEEYGELDASDVVTYYPHLSSEAFPATEYQNFFIEPSETFIKFIRNFGLTRIEFKLKKV